MSVHDREAPHNAVPGSTSRGLTAAAVGELIT
jgi:hypothetical protein